MMDSSYGLRLLDRYLNSKGKDISTVTSRGMLRLGRGDRRYETRFSQYSPEGERRLSKTSKYANAKFLDGVAKLVQTKGLHEAMNWLKTKHPYEEIVRTLGPQSKSEYLQPGQEAYGAFGLGGPKLPSYFLNRTGNFSTVTKDMWHARTLARWFGNRLTDATGKLIGNPPSRTTAQGLRMRRAVDSAWAEIGKRFNMQPAEVQQAMWEMEKTLYSKLGSHDDIKYISQGIDHGQQRIAESGSYPSLGDLRGEDGSASAKYNWERLKEFLALDNYRRNLRARQSGNSEPRPPTPGIPQGSAALGGHSSFTGQASDRSNSKRSLRLTDGSTATVRVKTTYSPTTDFATALSKHDLNALPVGFHEIASDAAGVAAFSKAFSNAKDATRLGQAMTLHSPQDYAGMRLFLSNDGRTGFALKPPRIGEYGYEIASPFTNGSPRAAMQSALHLASDLGARRIDVFDTHLPQVLADAGWLTTGRTKFHDSLAPADWNLEDFAEYNNGRPDVLHMTYHPDRAEPYVHGQKHGPIEQIHSQWRNRFGAGKAIHAKAARISKDYNLPLRTLE